MQFKKCSPCFIRSVFQHVHVFLCFLPLRNITLILQWCSIFRTTSQSFWSRGFGQVQDEILVFDSEDWLAPSTHEHARTHNIFLTVICFQTWHTESGLSPNYFATFIGELCNLWKVTICSTYTYLPYVTSDISEPKYLNKIHILCAWFETILERPIYLSPWIDA